MELRKILRRNPTQARIPIRKGHTRGSYELIEQSV